MMPRSARLLPLLALIAAAPSLAGAPPAEPLSLIDPLIAADVELQVRKWDRITIAATGKTIECRVIQEDQERLTYREIGADGQPVRSNATLSFKETPLSVLRANSAPDVYKGLKRKLSFAIDNVEHHAQLGLWCLRPEVQLETEARQHLMTALVLEPGRANLYDPALALFEKQLVQQKTPAEVDAEITICRAGFQAGIARLRLGFRAATLLEALGDKAGALHLLGQLDDLRADEFAAAPPLVQKSQDLRARQLAECGRREEARKYVASIVGEREGAGAVALWLTQGSWLLEDLAAGRGEARQELLALAEKLLAHPAAKGDAHVLRGCLHMLCDDVAAAEKDFIAAAGLGAIGAEQLVTYALNYARAGKFKKAEEVLLQVRNAPSVQIDYRLAKAYLLRSQGYDQEAAGLIAEAASLPNASWQTRLAHLQSLSGGAAGGVPEAEAQRYFADYMRLPVAFAEGSLLLGEQALRQEDGAAARRWLSYAASVFENDFEAQILHAHSHLLAGGDLLEARKALSTAVTLEPGNLDVLNALGCLEYREGNLPAARRHFDTVKTTFPERVVDEGPHPPALAYALRGLAQVEAAMTEEVWLDTFERPNGEQVLNNWLEQERFGVAIAIQGEALVFEGEQKHQDQQLTVVQRALPAERLSRFRARVRIKQGAQNVRVALRLEESQEDAPDGVVIFRETDGTLGFSLNRGGESQVFLPAAEGAEEDKEKKDSGDANDFDLARLSWPDDGLEHELEIRALTEQSGAVDLYFDGERLARGVQAPLGRGDAEIRVGVSGQAALGARYRFDVSRFEIMKKRRETKEKQRH